MTQKQFSIDSLILRQFWGDPLNESELSAIREWGARSVHHQQVLDNVTDPQWVKARLKEIYEAPTEKIDQLVAVGIAGHAAKYRKGLLPQFYAWTLKRVNLVLCKLNSPKRKSRP